MVNGGRGVLFWDWPPREPDLDGTVGRFIFSFILAGDAGASSSAITGGLDRGFFADIDGATKGLYWGRSC